MTAINLLLPLLFCLIHHYGLFKFPLHVSHVVCSEQMVQLVSFLLIIFKLNVKDTFCVYEFSSDPGRSIPYPGN